MSGRYWLVYSREHNAWWRPKAAGYTNDIASAGRYTKAEASAHCNTRDEQRDGSPSEVACLAPEAADVMADLLEALKAMMEGMEEPNERGIWGCRVVPSHRACSMAAEAIRSAEGTET